MERGAVGCARRGQRVRLLAQQCAQGEEIAGAVTADGPLDEAERRVVGARQSGGADQQLLAVAVAGGEEQRRAGPDQPVGPGAARLGEPVGGADHGAERVPRLGPVQAEVQHQAGVGEAAAHGREPGGQVRPQGMPVRQRVGEGAQGGQGCRDRTACAHPAQGRAAGAVLDIGAVGEPGPGARVENQLDGARGGARQVQVQFLGDPDEGGQALLPDPGGGRDIGARGPQPGRVRGQQCPEQGVPVVAGQSVQSLLGRFEGTCLRPEQRERLGAGLPDGCGEQGDGLERADSGGRIERLGGLRTPGCRALLPYQGDEPGEPVAVDAVPVHVLVVQGETGDGAEGAGRVVVQGEPAFGVAPEVPAAVGEDHDGAGAPAQHLTEAVHGLGASRSGCPRAERLDELHLPYRARRVGQRARGEGLQEDEERGAVLGGGGRGGGPVGQFGQVVEEGGPGQ